MYLYLKIFYHRKRLKIRTFLLNKNCEKYDGIIEMMKTPATVYFQNTQFSVITELKSTQCCKMILLKIKKWMKWHSFDSFSHLWLDPLLFPFILYHQAWTLQLWGVCKRSIFIGGNGQQQQIDLNFQLHVSLKLWICFVAWSAAPPQLWSSSIGKLTWVTWPLSQSRTWLWDTKRSSLFSDSGFSWQWQATELLQSFYRVTQQVLDIIL